MDPLTMMLISAGIGGLGNAFGLSQSSKANKKYDQYLSGMSGKLDNWYNKEINTNYLDTDEAKSALRLLQENARQVTDDMNSSSAITGASAEKQVAMKDKLNKGYTGATTQLAGQGTQRKDRIKEQYMNRQGNIDQLMLQNLMQKNQNWSQFGQNASGVAQAGIMAGTMGGFPQKPSGGKWVNNAGFNPQSSGSLMNFGKPNSLSPNQVGGGDFLNMLQLFQ